MKSLRINYKKCPTVGNSPSVRVGVVTSEGSQIQPSIITCLESFHGQINWISNPELPSESECDVVFEEVDAETIRIGFPVSGNYSDLHWTTISVLNTKASLALPSVVHTMLAPAFAHGLIGIDWADIRQIACSGKQGILALVSGELGEAMNEAHSIISATLNSFTYEPSVTGVIAVIFTPDANQALLNQFYQAVRLLETIAPSEQTVLVAAPTITDDKPMYALLVIINQ